LVQPVSKINVIMADNINTAVFFINYI